MNSDPTSRRSTGLSPLEELFCRKYVAFDGNGTRAAKAAGAPLAGAHNWASKKLRLIKIQQRIAKLEAEQLSKYEVSQAHILSELSKMGFANMDDYIRVNEEGLPITDFSELTRSQAAAITSITVDTYVEGRGDEAREVRRVKFTLADKPKSLELLGRHLKMFTDNVNVTNLDELAATISERRSRLEEKK